MRESRPHGGFRRAGIALLAMACLWSGCAAASRQTAAGDPRGTVLLPTGRSLSVEIADTPAKRALGYMFRDSVPPGQGMVFFMEEMAIHPFWMKNCRTALDIMWLDESWRIVHIESEVPPCKADPCPSYAPMRSSLYVLEVGPGEAGKQGLKIGDRITFVPPEKAEDREPAK